MENLQALEDYVLVRKIPPTLRKAKKGVIYILLLFLCIVISVFFAFPFIYMVLMSLI